MRRLIEGGAYSSKYGRRNFCVKNFASKRWFQAAEVDASSQTKQSMNSLFSKCSSDSVKQVSDNVNLFVIYIKIVVTSFRSSLKNHKFVFLFLDPCLTSMICSIGRKRCGTFAVLPLIVIV